MVALLLYVWLGRDAALAEIVAEILIGLIVIGGGGGKRIRVSLRRFLERMRERPALAAGL